MGSRIFRIAPVLSTLLLVVACGGGGDEPTPEPMESFATAGSIGSESAITSASARLTSLAYTNASATAVTARIDTTGSIALTGTASAFVSHEYRINDAAPVIERLPAGTGVAKTTSVSLPPGATIGITVAVGYTEPSGPVTMTWSNFATRLTITP
jgi:hypothetical protein